MNEDQIKAIVEEYDRELRGGIYVARHFLKWLSTRYCIVEREKVREHYKLALEDSEEMNEESDEKVFLELLFGTSMFNQNKE